ncbi:putative flavoprotein [Plasmodium gaboni]|uniref:Putative flavoprotein n=1 Tax=Plasmodium gaboni TaxID=647221 RepID=A0A151LI74_9APIC|nr:putative flavoprotein [Plasmodium gaboni]KYN98670.1 putative flavoprotein [Plasmodium gaboni]
MKCIECFENIEDFDENISNSSIKGIDNVIVSKKEKSLLLSNKDTLIIRNYKEGLSNINNESYNILSIGNSGRNKKETIINNIEKVYNRNVVNNIYSSDLLNRYYNKQKNHNLLHLEPSGKLYKNNEEYFKMALRYDPEKNEDNKKDDVCIQNENNDNISNVIDDDYFLKYSKFFNSKLRPKNLDEILKMLKENFLPNDDDNIIFITSGGTKVPLEKVDIRNIDNFSTGRRGALMCEYFLKKNKKVIFLHRRGSHLPFEYHLNGVANFNNLNLIDNNIITFNLKEDEKLNLINNIKNYEKYKENLFTVAFDTIFDYGYYLLEIGKLLNYNMKKRYEKYFNIKKDFDNKLVDDVYAKNILKDIVHLFSSYNNILNCKYNKEGGFYELLQKLILFKNLRLEKYNNNNRCYDLLYFFKYIFDILYDMNKKDQIILSDEGIKDIIVRAKLFINNINGYVQNISDDYILNDIKDVKYNVNNNNMYIYENINNINFCNSVNMNGKINENISNVVNNKSDEFLFPSHLMILCAAASDFYIPFDELLDFKIDSNNCPFQIEMHLTPKFYKITYKYFPFLKHCIFKLEDQDDALIKKSNERLQHADMLIANILTQRNMFVYIFKKEQEYFKLTKSKGEPIENNICREVCKHFSII